MVSCADQRYMTAVNVAKAVWATLSSLEERQRTLLQLFLHHTKATLVCELLQKEYQHIIDLSHLPRNKLVVRDYYNKLWYPV